MGGAGKVFGCVREDLGGNECIIWSITLIIIILEIYGRGVVARLTMFTPRAGISINVPAEGTLTSPAESLARSQVRRRVPRPKNFYQEPPKHHGACAYHHNTIHYIQSGYCA